MDGIFEITELLKKNDFTKRLTKVIEKVRLCLAFNKSLLFQQLMSNIPQSFIDYHISHMSGKVRKER